MVSLDRTVSVSYGHAPLSVKGSQKIFISGPIVKKDVGKEAFRNWIQKEATKLGDIENIVVKELPDEFCFAQVRAHGLTPVVGIVRFTAPGTASKFIAAFHGKLYEKQTCLDVQRIHEKLTIEKILLRCGTPNYSDDSFSFAIVCSIFASSLEMMEGIKKKLNDVVPYEEAEPVNLTKQFNLKKGTRDPCSPAYTS